MALLVLLNCWCVSYESNKYYKIGANVEGILRQAADVDEVERRVREYEQGLCFCS